MINEFSLLMVLTRIWAALVVLKPGATIPSGMWMSGAAFNLCRCPNLLGETIEWLGFASSPGASPLAFALWSIANLVPRALWRRSWYRTNFPDFPRSRASLILGLH